MSRRMVCVIDCDGPGADGEGACGARYSCDVELAGDTRRAAATEGWTHEIGAGTRSGQGPAPSIDLCPGCRAVRLAA